jgi:hypothetical protein
MSQNPELDCCPVQPYRWKGLGTSLHHCLEYRDHCSRKYPPTGSEPDDTASSTGTNAPEIR